MKINKQVLKTEVSYLILPQGVRCQSIDEVVEKRRKLAGETWVREYTLVTKAITIEHGGRKTRVKGEYLTSKGVE